MDSNGFSTKKTREKLRIFPKKEYFNFLPTGKNLRFTL